MLFGARKLNDSLHCGGELEIIIYFCSMKCAKVFLKCEGGSHIANQLFCKVKREVKCEVKCLLKCLIKVNN